MKRYSIHLIALSCLLSQVAPGQWTEPELLPPPINVDPPCQYYYSTISADGQVLCMTLFCSGITDDDIYFSEKLTDSTWSRPVNAGPNINNNQRNLSPSITNDCQTLYYVSYDGDYRIYVSHRTGPDWDDWSPGVPLSEPVNRGFQFTGQISFDDSTLVFTSRGQPGILYGEDAMYSSRQQPDGSWSEPHLFGFHLNHLNGSLHPCLTDSGNTLVYGMYGGIHFDIFYTSRNDTGFGPAIRCDSTINTSFWDSGPSCSVDGSLLYFESRRPIQPSDTFGIARLFVARRTTTSIRAFQRSGYPKRESILISPTMGSSNTIFRISVPDRLKGQAIAIYNVLGQRIDLIQPNDLQQSVYLWKGFSNGKVEISNGVYFLIMDDKYRTPLGKITLVK